MVCAGVPRIITSNVGSLAEFLGKGIPCSDPLRRKCIVFNVEKPLCSAAWVESLRGDRVQDVEVGATTSIMADRMRHIAAVVTDVAAASSSVCPLACRRRAA